MNFSIHYLSIALIPLQNKYVELIRRWRNQSSVRTRMEYKKKISSQEQRTWFRNLDTWRNQYFIIRHQEQLGGVLQLSNIDYSHKKAEVGIFIGSPLWKGTCLPWLASYTLLRYAFESLGLSVLYAKVGQMNQRTIAYNQSLGFDFLKDLSRSFSIYHLTANRWKKKIYSFQDLIDRLAQSHPYQLMLNPPGEKVKLVENHSSGIQVQY
ncbi:MAG: GNAT family N-acetyltransferase [Cytophagales bacterium]|nr:GNAT family N-acetyltransferase [Cytophagales bacterium]